MGRIIKRIVQRANIDPAKRTKEAVFEGVGFSTRQEFHEALEGHRCGTCKLIWIGPHKCKVAATAVRDWSESYLGRAK